MRRSRRRADSSKASTSSTHDHSEEDHEAEGPEALRDDQRNAQQADVGRAEHQRFLDEAHRAVGEEGREHAEQRQGEEMQSGAQPQRQRG